MSDQADSALVGEDTATSRSSELSDEQEQSSKSTRSAGFSGRRLGVVLVLSLLSAVLFALAPLSLSLPFGVVALLAPVLASCDFRHSRAKQHTVQHDSTHSDALIKEAAVGSADTETEKEMDAASTGSKERGSFEKINELQAEPLLRKAKAHVKMEEKQFDGGSNSLGAAGATIRSAATGAPGNVVSSSSRAGGSIVKVEHDGVSSHNPAGLSLVRSEERMSIRKERVVTSRLIVRKVVTTEMVIMSVPVRRERLEVETVYEEQPLPASDDAEFESESEQTTTKGYVRPLPPLPSDSDGSTGFSMSSPRSSLDASSDCARYNSVFVNEAGQEVLELLLCEERPRIEMDIAPVTRVLVTKTAFPASQLVHMELRKEQIEYIAPQQPAHSSRQQAGHITQVE